MGGTVSLWNWVAVVLKNAGHPAVDFKFFHFFFFLFSFISLSALAMSVSVMGGIKKLTPKQISQQKFIS